MTEWAWTEEQYLRCRYDTIAKVVALALDWRACMQRINEEWAYDLETAHAEMWAQFLDHLDTIADLLCETNGRP